MSVREFYAKLFRKNQEKHKTIEDYIKKKSLPKVPKTKHNELLTVEELGISLKQMKNNKTPGLDGLPVDFLKVFWKCLKFFVRNALNSCFKKGILSTTLKESIITCLPKGKKDRKFLKNWRPIPLLCSTYKLASLSVATHIKPQLNKIISKNPTGFLKGRSISDCTRLIYDLLFETEKHNEPSDS